MKRAVQIFLVTIAMAAAGMSGWWIRARHCDIDVAPVGDFHATGIRYTARAYWETNRDLDIELLRSDGARCLVVPRSADSIEILFFSGGSNTEFPYELKDQLSAFALKRLAEITLEDQKKAAKP
jgi:hypothetical protein